MNSESNNNILSVSYIQLQSLSSHSTLTMQCSSLAGILDLCTDGHKINLLFANVNMSSMLFPFIIIITVIISSSSSSIWKILLKTDYGLNLSHTAYKFQIITISVTVDLQPCIICRYVYDNLHIILKMPNYNGSLITAVKLKAKENFHVTAT